MTTGILLEAGQIWGASNSRKRRRHIVFVTDQSVAFHVEGKNDSGAPEISSMDDFIEWIDWQGAEPLELDAAARSQEISDKEIGRRLKKHRLSARMSQGDVAVRANVSRTAISLWESGRRGCSMKRLSDIAIAIGVTFADLIERQPLPDQPVPTNEPSPDTTLSAEEKHLLSFFRSVDHPSRQEALRWLETRAVTSCLYPVKSENSPGQEALPDKDGCMTQPPKHHMENLPHS